MSEFALHPRLEADTVFVANWTLSRVLLMNDARYPWLVLVPRKPQVSEFFELDQAERGVLGEEMARAARGLKEVARAPKINIGTLGNLVPQLHVHIVARSPADPAWPGPVWGHGTSVQYPPASRDDLIAQLVKAL